ncbi:MAG TPA: diaminopimelate epimerase [Longimicrobiales bacterium]
MPEIPFAKGHALGNDYIVIDAADLGGLPAPALVRALCDRHRGIGADGVLAGMLDGAPIRLRIFNPDGSEAEKSGNGLRIFGAYLHGRGLIADAPFDIALAQEVVTLQVTGAGPGGVLDIRADMGRASFRAEDVGFAPPGGAGEWAEGVVLSLGDGAAARVYPVSMGNPHCVIFADRLDREDFLRRAPALAAHPAFTRGTNVQFARVSGPARLDAWIYERGAGETLASGSSACAIAAAAARLGLVEAHEITIRMPGGSVRVELYDDARVRLRGPAQILYHGRLRAAVSESWLAPQTSS